MAKITDWLARTLFVSDEQIALEEQVKEAQQKRIQEQLDQGTIGLGTWLDLSQDIHGSAGRVAYDRELGKPGVAGVPGLALSYWWIWALVGLGAFIYLGGGPWLLKQAKGLKGVLGR